MAPRTKSSETTTELKKRKSSLNQKIRLFHQSSSTILARRGSKELPPTARRRSSAPELFNVELPDPQIIITRAWKTGDELFSFNANISVRVNGDVIPEIRTGDKITICYYDDEPSSRLYAKINNGNLVFIPRQFLPRQASEIMSNPYLCCIEAFHQYSHLLLKTAYTDSSNTRLWSIQDLVTLFINSGKLSWLLQFFAKYEYEKDSKTIFREDDSPIIIILKTLFSSERCPVITKFTQSLFEDLIEDVNKRCVLQTRDIAYYTKKFIEKIANLEMKDLPKKLVYVLSVLYPPLEIKFGTDLACNLLGSMVMLRFIVPKTAIPKLSKVTKALQHVANKVEPHDDTLSEIQNDITALFPIMDKFYARIASLNEMPPEFTSETVELSKSKIIFDWLEQAKSSLEESEQIFIDGLIGRIHKLEQLRRTHQPSLIEIATSPHRVPGK